MRLVRTFIVGFLMLWLPLQAIAAVSMPFCAHAGMEGGRHAGMTEAARTDAHAHHQHEHSPAPSQHDHRDTGPHAAAGTLEQCNNCGACNLACAPAVPMSPLLLARLDVTVQPDFSARSPGLFIPDRPQPPPNSRF